MATSKNIRNIVRNASAGIIQCGTNSLSDDTEDVKGDNKLSLLSPSSGYSHSELRHLSHGFINSMLLCHWDNILGPRIIHLWTISGRMSYPVSTLMQICSQSLSGEICRDVYNSFIDFKFYDIPEKQVIVPAFIFTANKAGGPGVHSLSLIIPKSNLTLYLQIHQLLQRCFERIVGKLRIIMNKWDAISEIPREEFRIHITDCMEMLASLTVSALPDTVKLPETFLYPSHLLEREFLRSCISSHLTTFGKSFVIGDSVEKINMLLSTLALFNTCEERRCSRIVDTNHHPYHHDLYLQGALRKSDHIFEYPVQEILYSKYPTTIIDLTQQVVKQSPIYSDHVVHSYDTQRNELTCLHHGDNNDIAIPGGEILTQVDITETLIQGLLEELDKLPAECGVREAYILQFMRVVQKKAVCLIKYLEGETNYGAQAFKGGTRKLRHDLLITTDGDLRIIMAAAEKLKPGIVWFIMGGGDYSNRQISTEY